jgi:hypothetical protein
MSKDFLGGLGIRPPPHFPYSIWKKGYKRKERRQEDPDLE